MKKIFLAFFCLPFYVFSQTCDGNLGDNIFEEGDFGSGAANILLPNPGIAPQYNYTTNPPPPDGSYVVTNNTGVWSGLYPSWLAIGDNSNDPNGYMMVVNADFTPALFYNQTIDELCENTQYEFSADIINLIAVGVAGHIEPNVSFLIDGEVQFTTGDIPSTNEWQTYGFTFTTGPGVTEVELSLRNNAQGGIGNDLGLDNISFRTCGDSAFILPEEPTNICDDGEPLSLYTTVVGELYANPAIQWQVSPDGFNNWTDIAGANDTVFLHTILASGEYYYRYQLADGATNLLNEKCRINSNVKKVIVLPTEFFVQDTICAGESLLVGNSAYTEMGLYVDSLINSLGCDSIVSTDLTVILDPGIIAEIEVDSTSCYDKLDGQIEILEVNGGNAPYSFNFEGIDVGETMLFEDLEGDRQYDLTIADRFGCMVSQRIYVPRPSELTLDLGPYLYPELGEEVTITANTNFMVEHYLWNNAPFDSLFCTMVTDCSRVSLLPTKRQTVYLVAQDANNCSVRDSVRVNIYLNYKLYVPNVFSPNDDGINDRFTIFGPQPRISNIQQLQVFDRWGQLVFSGTNLTPGDLNQGWDGRAKGQKVNSGVYIYRANVEFLNGKVLEVGGDITVVY